MTHRGLRTSRAVTRDFGIIDATLWRWVSGDRRNLQSSHGCHRCLQSGSDDKGLSVIFFRRHFNADSRSSWRTGTVVIGTNGMSPGVFGKYRPVFGHNTERTETMNISFALTAREFITGIKTETRRDWTDRTLRMWQRAWDEGRRIHQATDRPLHRGGKVIGSLELTARPEREPLNTMTKTSLKAEGGMCATLPEYYELMGQTPEKVMTVVRFRRI